MSVKQNSESSKAILRAEYSTRIREALELRDWNQLEHWAKQWIQIEPQNPSAFKWLARAALALNQIKRAAYAYGRLLDFDPSNSEARKFFTDYPSALRDQPGSVEQKIAPRSSVTAPGARGAADRPANAGTGDLSHILSPDQRRTLAQAEYELAEAYSSFRIFSEAAARYLKSFEWHPTKASALGAARSLHKQQKGNEALKFLRQQLYFFPDWVEGRLFLGRILLDMGYRADAQREWQTVLELEPKNQEALNFLRALLSR